MKPCKNANTAESVFTLWPLTIVACTDSNTISDNHWRQQWCKQWTVDRHNSWTPPSPSYLQVVGWTSNLRMKHSLLSCGTTKWQRSSCYNLGEKDLQGQKCFKSVFKWTDCKAKERNRQKKTDHSVGYNNSHDRFRHYNTLNGGLW